MVNWRLLVGLVLALQLFGCGKRAEVETKTLEVFLHPDVYAGLDQYNIETDLETLFVANAFTVELDGQAPAPLAGPALEVHWCNQAEWDELWDQREYGGAVYPEQEPGQFFVNEAPIQYLGVIQGFGTCLNHDNAVQLWVQMDNHEQEGSIRSFEGERIDSELLDYEIDQAFTWTKRDTERAVALTIAHEIGWHKIGGHGPTMIPPSSGEGGIDPVHVGSGKSGCWGAFIDYGLRDGTFPPWLDDEIEAIQKWFGYRR